MTEAMRRRPRAAASHEAVWRRRAVLTALTFSLAVGALGCGGGGGGGDDGDTGADREGVFVDAPVAGLPYETASGGAVTDALGRFRYRNGETVRFHLGGIELGSAVGGTQVTPIDLVPGGSAGDRRVVNRVRLLLTLDSDGDPTNGLSIAGEAAQAGQGRSVDFDQDPSAFSSDAAVSSFLNAAAPGATLVSADEATAHFLDSLGAVGFKAADLVGSWDLVGLAGDHPDSIGWAYGSWSVAEGGATTWTALHNSLGDAAPPTYGFSLAISPDGRIGGSGGSAKTDMGTFQASLARTRDLWAGTQVDGGGGLGLLVGVRSGGAYSQADLAGEWRFFLLSSGMEAGQNTWAYGKAALDEEGDLSWVDYANLSGEDAADLPSPNARLSLEADGIITGSGGTASTDFSTLHGRMNHRKDVFVTTMTDGGGGYDLIVWQRVGSGFDPADLSGVWTVAYLATGYDAVEDPEILSWPVSIDVDIGPAGALEFVEARNPSGTLITPAPVSYYSLSLAADGTVRGAGTSPSGLTDFGTFHGAMNQDGMLVVGTSTAGGGKPAMWIFVRK